MIEIQKNIVVKYSIVIIEINTMSLYFDMFVSLFTTGYFSKDHKTKKEV